MLKHKLKYMINELTMLFVLFAIFIFFSVSADNFLTSVNIINIMRQVAMIGITSVGMTYVIITAGMDLSAGSVLALSGIVTGIAMVQWDVNPVMAAGMGLAAGMAIGLVNGAVITYIKIPPLVTTLATMQIFRGVCYIITGGMPVFGFPSGFGVLGKGYLSIIPIPVVIMLLLMLAGWIVLNKTKYGRYVYAVGGNAEAARLSGIKVNRVLLATYTLSGLFAAISGIVMASRVDSGQPNIGQDFGLDVITAVVLGGVSIMGGEGKLTGVIIGVFIMGVLSNGLVMMNVYDYYQYIIKGLVLLVAVGVDQLSKMRKSKKVQKSVA